MTYLPLGISGVPAGIAVDQSSGRVYVAVAGSNELGVIDGLANAVVDTIHGLPDPTAVAVNPSNQLVYVTNSRGPNNPGLLSFIDAGSDNFTGNAIEVGSNPWAVAVDTATNRVLVGGNDEVTMVDGNSHTAIGHIAIPNGNPNFQVNGIAADAQHKRFFVTTSDTSSTSGAGSTLVVDEGTKAVTAALQTGQAPNGVDYDPTTDRAYVANSISSTLSVITDVLQLEAHPAPCQGGTCI